MFPVGERETCGCFWEQWKAACKCHYVDFEKSKASPTIVELVIMLIILCL